jgi:hypothetical protein
MRDSISVNVSTEPAEEDGPQVGQTNYQSECIKNGRVFIKMLIRQFGEPPGSARLVLKGNPHDFGTYYTVDCVFDDQDEAAVEYAYKLENECPGQWDQEARQELGLPVW